MNTFDFDCSGACVHYATPVATTPSEQGRLQIKRLIARAWLNERLNFCPRAFANRQDSLEALWRLSAKVQR